MPRIPDTLVDPLLVALNDCLYEELIDTAYGPPHRSYVTHSVGPPLDDGCWCQGETVIGGQPVATNGDGRVRLVTLGPDTTIILGPASSRCPPGWQALIELSTSRCIPVSDSAEPLPADTMEQVALELGDDRAALLRVLQCCEALDDRDISVSRVFPVGPQGACAGWAMEIIVSLSGGPGGCP